MKKAIIAVVFVAAAVWLWVYLQPSEERRIAKRLQALESAFAMGPDESVVSLVTKQASIEELLAESVHIDLTGVSSFGTEFSPEALSSLVLRFKKMHKTVALSLIDTEFIFIEARLAEITFTARMATTDWNGGRSTDTREIRAKLAKGEDHWRFASLEEEVVLER